VLLALLAPWTARAETQVSGAITTPTTWTVAGSPYVMTADVVVQVGATLTIEPGVEVQGTNAESGDVELVVRGGLVASGTEAAPILFRARNSETAGAWEGLRFESTATATLQHVRILHADFPLEFANPTAANFTLDGITIRKFASRAINAAGGGALTMARLDVDGEGSASADAFNLSATSLTLADSVLRRVDDGIWAENASVTLTRVVVANASDGVEFRVTVSPNRTLSVSRCTFYANNSAVSVFRSDSTYQATVAISRSLFGLNASIYTDLATRSYYTSTFQSFGENVWWGPRILNGTYPPPLPANATTSLRYNGLLVDPDNGNYAPTERSPARYFGPATPSAIVGAIAYAGAPTGPGVHGFWYQSTTFPPGTSVQVAGDVVVARGATLTFQPGAEFLFLGTDLMAGGVDPGRIEVRVEGTLEADGTNSRPVRFTSAKASPQPGDWYGVLILSNTEAFNVSQVNLGYAVRGVTLTNNDHVVAGSTIHHCSDAGIYVDDGTPNVEQVVLHDNRDGLAVVNTANVDLTGVTIRHSSNVGLRVVDSTFNLSDAVIRDNASHGVSISNTTVANTGTLTHCTVAHNAGDGLWYQRTDSSYALTVNLVSSSLTHNGGVGVRDAGTRSYYMAPFHCNGSNAWGNTGGNYASGPDGTRVGCFSYNPLYADAAGRNYEPTRWSPNRKLGKTNSHVGALPYVSAVGPRIMGYLWEDYTFTAAASPHPVLGDVVIPSGVTVTMEAGATLRVVPNADGMGGGLNESRAEIRVLDGGKVLFPREGAPVTLRPDSAAPSAGMWYGLRLENAGTSIIDNAVIEYPTWGVYAVGPRAPLVEDTTVRFHASAGLRFEGVTTSPTVDVMAVQVIGTGTGDGIQLANSSGRVRSSYVTHHATGISATVNNASTQAVHLINNTVVHQDVGIYYQRTDSSYVFTVNVYNNLVVNSRSYALQDAATRSYYSAYDALKNNVFFGVATRVGDHDVFTNNLTTDPKIEDDDWDRYPRWWDGKVWATSLAINAGDAAAPQIPTRDILGKARNLGGGVDIGAWEFDAAANQEPRADAVARGMMVPRGEVFTLDGAAAMDPDGTIASAYWTVSDGTVLPGLTVQHTLASAGENQWAYLTILDNVGAEDHARVDLNSNMRPVADAGPAVYQDVGPEESVFFDGTLSTDPDGTLVSWTWDFGDGSPVSTERSPRHSYLSAGLFTVTLTVRDNEGLTDTDTTLATVFGTVDTAGPLIQHVAIPDGQPVNVAVTVTATIQDPSSVAAAVVYYRATGGTTATPVVMTHAGNNVWQATIPGGAVTSAGVDYWITALDGVIPVGNASALPAGAPAVVFSFRVSGDNDPPVITHTEITNGQPPGVAVTINATITDATGVGSAKLFFRPSTGTSFGAADMVRGAGNTWTAQIPAFVVAPPAVQYYLQAVDTSPVPKTAFAPAGAPGVLYDFVVGTADQTPPVITHVPVANGQPEGTAVTVTATITDDSGTVSAATLRYQSGAVFVPVAMTRGAGTSWSGVIPANAVVVGTLSYYLHAEDAAENEATSPAGAPGVVHTFRVDAVDRAGPTITHTPVTNGQVEGRDVVISAQVEDASGVDFARVHYRQQGFPFFQELVMTPAGGLFTATIPAAYVASPAVEYYVRAVDEVGNTSYSPGTAPAQWHTFTVVGSDSAGPVVTHTPVTSPRDANVAVVVEATVVDATGVSGVALFHRVGTSGAFLELAMALAGTDLWRATIPAGSVLQPSVQYYLVATDSAPGHNVTTHPSTAPGTPLSFTVTAAVPRPVAGDLAVTEVMQDPNLVSDANGEWFEVQNLSDHDLELTGVRFSNTRGNSFTVSGSLTVAAGQYLVFGKSTDRAVNGGITVHYAFGTQFSLGNAADGITITSALGVELDRIAWDGGVTWPDPTGASMQLDGALDPRVVDNSLPAHWCVATTPIATPGDLGTPGAANTPCAVVNPCSPNPCTTAPLADCVDDKTRRTYAQPGTCANVGGVAQCTYAPTTVTCPGTDVCRGGVCVSGVVAVNWCRLEAPLTATLVEGGDVTVTGRVYQPGTTDLTDGVDASSFLLAEVGFGPASTLPGVATGWAWTPAVGNPLWSGAAAGEPDNDEYLADLSVSVAGTYDYAYRFSADGGLSWTYCDGGAGSTDGYTLPNAGHLLVTPLVDPCNPNPCTTPVPATCDANTAVSWAVPGACTAVNGVAQCSYTEQRTACGTQVCVEGACVANPCVPNPCTTPPAATCVDDTTRTSYAVPGGCAVVDAHAECTYTASTVTCGGGERCVDGVCGAVVPGPMPGEIVITEVMQNPKAVLDSAGEWFEITNASNHLIELAGVRFSDLGADGFTLDVASLTLAPGAYLVLGRNANPAVNGGVTVHHAYGSKMTLGNAADAIVITNQAGVEVDRVVYDGGPLWPDPDGASMQLSGTLDLATGDNNSPAHWCVATQPITAGSPTSDKGTPGAANTSCSAPVPPVDLCRLQSPLTHETDPGQPIVVSGRVREATVTDRSTSVDPHPLLVGAAGYGPDGSDPANNGAWTWVTAAGDANWDGQAAGEPALDQYVASVVAPAAGTYDLAFRFSVDGGATWTYCDGGNGSADGYSPAQSGSLTVRTPTSPCDPNPCLSPPGSTCDGDVAISHPSPGTCTITGTTFSCAYADVRTTCTATGKLCLAGECVANPCSPNPCTTPPPDGCADGTTRRTHVSPGTCLAAGTEADCTYAEVLVACPAGAACVGGTCGTTAVTPGPGDLVITEVMQNPDVVSDTAGEWFEVLNVSGRVLDINGLRVTDGASNNFTVNAPGLVAPVGGYLVLGRSSTEATNGGVHVDYAYGGAMALNNDADKIILLNTRGEEVDRVEYDGGPAWPDPTGASMQFDGALDPRVADNNSGAAWCVSTAPIRASGATDKGTPGAANAPCAPPPLAVTMCRLQGPLDVSTSPGSPLSFTGRVLVPGVTDVGPGVATDARVVGEVGHGPDGSNPAGSGSWAWTRATPNALWDGAAAGEPTLDEYQAAATAPAAGTYDVAFRFSADGGLTWTYCDGDANGSANGYSPANAGALLSVASADPCDPNPCTVAPPADCLDDTTRRTYAAPGTCDVVNSVARCSHAAQSHPCQGAETCLGGVCAVVVRTPAVGDLVVTEVMPDPKAVTDANGEWFEVRNVTGHALELAGVTFTDEGSDSFTVAGPLVVPAGQYLLLAKKADSAVNGGLTPGYVYGGGMNLGNSADKIVIRNQGGQEVDRVAYSGSAWPWSAGVAMQLDSRLDMVTADNSDPSAWCAATRPVVDANPAGDLGTPGLPNTPCGPVTVPVDFCRFQGPLSVVTNPGLPTLFSGRVRQGGITDRTAAVDTDPSLLAQLGWGPDGSHPEGTPGWTWQQALPNGTWNGETAGEATLDEYESTLAAPALGRYDVAFRFSADSGLTWTYCDGAEGSADGYAPAQAGDLLVQAVPNPCSPNPCASPPGAACEDQVAITYPATGTCSVVSGAAACTYAATWTTCSAFGMVCAAGACVVRDVQGPTITHTPLTSPVEAGTTLTVEAAVQDPAGVGDVVLRYRLAGGVWQEEAMVVVSGSTYRVAVPALAVVPPGFDYVVGAVDLLGNGSTHPATGESDPHHVTVVPVGTDITPPSITHTPPATAVAGRPLVLEAVITDASGVGRTEVKFRPRGVLSWQTLTLAAGEDDAYAATIPSDAVVVGTLQYYLEAVDQAALANVATHPGGAPAAFHSVVVAAEGTDAGVTDAHVVDAHEAWDGAVAPDASAAADAGPAPDAAVRRDAAGGADGPVVTRPDAAVVEEPDAGGGGGGDVEGPDGCGCSAERAAAPGTLAWGLVLVGVVAWRRRRR
jgi:MYXO-CTERM domain-containing protein